MLQLLAHIITHKIFAGKVMHSGFEKNMFPGELILPIRQDKNFSKTVQESLLHTKRNVIFSGTSKSNSTFSGSFTSMNLSGTKHL